MGWRSSNWSCAGGSCGSKLIRSSTGLGGGRAANLPSNPPRPVRTLAPRLSTPTARAASPKRILPGPALLGLDEGGGRRRRDVTAVALELPARVIEALALGVGREDPDARLLGEGLDLVLPGPGPLAAEPGPLSGAEWHVEVAPADTPPRFEDDDRPARALEG